MDTTMNWMQWYVENVKTYLPRRLREDVGSELYSSLQDQCDDMADSLGRRPDEAEILALLKEKGHPMQVAAAYQPHRTLVSEELFPLYVLALKWMLAIVAVVNAVVGILSLFGQPQPDFLRAALQLLAATFNGGLHGFAWITLGFYLAGESISYSDVFGKWNPRRMVRIVDGNRRIDRFESAVELVVVLVMMAWLNDLFAAVVPAAGETVRFVFSAELHDLLPWLNIAMGLSILMSLDKLARPYWTRPRLLIDGAINLYWLVLFAILFNLQQVFTAHWTGAGAWQWEMPVTNWRIIMVVAFAITAYDLGKNIRRYFRATRSSQ